MPRARARGVGSPPTSANRRRIATSQSRASTRARTRRASERRERGDAATARAASRGGARNARVGDKDGAIRDAADDFERGGGARRAREDELGRASVDEDERVVDASRDGRR